MNGFPPPTPIIVIVVVVAVTIISSVLVGYIYSSSVRQLLQSSDPLCVYSYLGDPSNYRNTS